MDVKDQVLGATLPDKFALAQRLRLQLRAGGHHPGTEEYRVLQSRALTMYAECLMMAEQLGIVGNREPIDEVSTPALRFMALDFYIGQLLDESYINPSEGSILARFRVAKSAMRLYYNFLVNLADHGIIDAQSRSEYKEVLPYGRHGNYEVSKLLLGLLNGKPNPYTGARLARRQADSRRPENHHDEESQRKIELWHLRKLEYETFDSLKSSWREIELLLMSLPAGDRRRAVEEPEDVYMPPMLLAANRVGRGLPAGFDFANAGDTFDFASLVGSAHAAGNDPTFADAREQHKHADRQNQDYSRKVEYVTPSGAAGAGGGLVGPKGEIRQPFTITKDRNDVARQVFGTGQVLPTMTIEELAELELARRVPDAVEKPEVDEDRDEYQDAETERRRRWDDFAEANARGSGNTMNRG